MSIERYGGEISLQCDKCAESFGPYFADEFHELVADARNKGWAVYRSRGEWAHRCPSCARPSAAEDFA